MEDRGSLRGRCFVVKCQAHPAMNHRASAGEPVKARRGRGFNPLVYTLDPSMRLVPSVVDLDNGLPPFGRRCRGEAPPGAEALFEAGFDVAQAGAFAVYRKRRVCGGQQGVAAALSITRRRPDVQPSANSPRSILALMVR